MFGFFKRGNKNKDKNDENDKNDDKEEDHEKNMTKLDTKSTNQVDDIPHDLSPSVPRKRSVRFLIFLERERERERVEILIEFIT